MASIIEISQLDFAYAGQLVLKQIDLHIERGTTVGVIGPNGAGKTTLIRLILGLLRPTRGSIRVAGLPPRQAVTRGDVIGYLPQNPAVASGLPLSVSQAVRLGLAGKTGMFRPYAADDLRFIDRLMERVGIAELRDVPVSELSGGQLQRMLIAHALAPRPKVLLLDEPMTGIDASGQQRFIEFIGALKAELELTVLLVSHDLRAVSLVSDRVACLNVTLHYHDIPQHMPADLMYRLFACDVEAVGMGASAGATPAAGAVTEQASRQGAPAQRSDQAVQPMQRHEHVE